MKWKPRQFRLEDIFIDKMDLIANYLTIERGKRASRADALRFALIEVEKKFEKEFKKIKKQPVDTSTQEETSEI